MGHDHVPVLRPVRVQPVVSGVLTAFAVAEVVVVLRYRSTFAWGTVTT